MNTNLTIAGHTQFLDNDEITRLITTAQDVPTVQITEDDGTETTTYWNTAEADAALEELTRAFLPLIHRIAGTAKQNGIPEDDALQICLEEFISVVRRYRPGSALPFQAGLATILARKLSDTERTSDLVVVKENVSARYWQLMHKHGLENRPRNEVFRDAYNECKNTANGLDPATFLSAYRAISGYDGFEGTAAIGDSTGGGKGDQDGTRSSAEHRMDRLMMEAGAFTDGPENATVQADVVRYLFTLVSERQRQILRLRYGFSDPATQNARLAAGFRADRDELVMSDREVAQVLGSSTPTVGRQRHEALATMRAALEEAENA